MLSGSYFNDIIFTIIIFEVICIFLDAQMATFRHSSAAPVATATIVRYPINLFNAVHQHFVIVVLEWLDGAAVGFNIEQDRSVGRRLCHV